MTDNIPWKRPTLEDAISFAELSHQNQRDAGGKPYVDHLKRVMARVRDTLDKLPKGLMYKETRENILIAAIFHDILEDHEHTGVTIRTLLDLGYPPKVIHIVKRLSGRPEGVSYIENIEAMVREAELGVILIKLSDNEDNSDPERIAQLPPERQSIVRRYERSMALLRPALERAISHHINFAPWVGEG